MRNLEEYIQSNKFQIEPEEWRLLESSKKSSEFNLNESDNQQQYHHNSSGRSNNETTIKWSLTWELFNWHTWEPNSLAFLRNARFSIRCIISSSNIPALLSVFSLDCFKTCQNTTNKQTSNFKFLLYLIKKTEIFLPQVSRYKPNSKAVLKRLKRISLLSPTL